MMKPRRLAILYSVCLLAGSMMAHSASADLIYSNDFEAETLNARPAAPFGFLGTGGSNSLVRPDDGTVGSQYLELTSRSDNGAFGFAFFDGSSLAGPFSAVTTFSFDACFDSSFGTTSADGKLRLRSRPSNTTGADDISRADLDGDEVIIGSVNSYSYVVNNSSVASSVENEAGQTIAANSWAIYQNGVLLETGSNQGSAPSANPAFLTLWLRGNTTAGAISQSTVKLDNFRVYNNIMTVPEPGTAGLLGFAFVAISFRRRKV